MCFSCRKRTSDKMFHWCKTRVNQLCPVAKPNFRVSWQILLRTWNLIICHMILRMRQVSVAGRPIIRRWFSKSHWPLMKNNFLPKRKRHTLTWRITKFNILLLYPLSCHDFYQFLFFLFILLFLLLFCFVPSPFYHQPSACIRCSFYRYPIGEHCLVGLKGD